MREKLRKNGKEIRRKYSKFCQVKLKSCNSLCSAPLETFATLQLLRRGKKRQRLHPATEQGAEEVERPLAGCAMAARVVTRSPWMTGSSDLMSEHDFTMRR